MVLSRYQVGKVQVGSAGPTCRIADPGVCRPYLINYITYLFRFTVMQLPPTVKTTDTFV